MKNGQLSRGEADFIREYVAQAETDEDRRHLREECAAEFGVSIQAIRAVTAWTKIYQNRASGALSIEDNSLTTSDVKMNGFDANNSTDIDYENDVKNKWRMKWKEFIAENMTPEQRRCAKVLCLPGAKCLEIPLYLDLGFTPSNIVGVEGGNERMRDDFLLNAERFGIQPHLGRLEDFVAEDTTPWDVVSLDFLGQMSEASITIAREILINRRALMLTNFLAKRERREFQSALNTVRNYMVIDKNQFKKHGVYTLSEVEKDAIEDFLEGDASLAESRTVLGLNYFGNVGMYRPENRLFRERMNTMPVHFAMDSKYPGEKLTRSKRFALERFNIERGIESVLKAMEDLFVGYSYNRSEARNTTFIAKALADRALYGVPLVMGLKSYRYISQSGAGTSPFESDFGVLVKPLDIHESTRRTTGFIYDACASTIASINAREPSPYMILRDKHGIVVPPNTRLARSYSFNWESPGGQTINSLNVGKFFNDVNAYLDVAREGIPDQISRGEFELKRENIE